MLKVETNQSLLRGGEQIPLMKLQKAAQATMEAVGKQGKAVSLGFVSEKEIRRLNALYRGKNKTTDVLSFADGENGQLGEILICYPQARRQAERIGHSTRKEVFFLFVHGLLHLYGLDHGPKNTGRMFSIQKRILNRL